MGSGASTNTIEVSFVDNETGKMLDDKTIEILSEEAYDLSQKFYAAFRDPERLAKMAEEWRKNEAIRNENIMWFKTDI